MTRGEGVVGGVRGGRRHERAGEMNWMLFFFPKSMKKRAMGSEGFYSQRLSQVIHHSALSKELSTTWDEQWHCDCRDRSARDWEISAICWASERRPKAREGGLKVEEEKEEEVAVEALADENQKIWTLWHGCQGSCVRNCCCNLQIWSSSHERVEVERRNVQIRAGCVTESSAALNASWTYASSSDQTCWVYLAQQVRSKCVASKKKNLWWSLLYFFTYYWDN